MRRRPPGELERHVEADLLTSRAAQLLTRGPRRSPPIMTDRGTVHSPLLPATIAVAAFLTAPEHSRFLGLVGPAMTLVWLGLPPVPQSRLRVQPHNPSTEPDLPEKASSVSGVHADQVGHPDQGPAPVHSEGSMSLSRRAVKVLLGRERVLREVADMAQAIEQLRSGLRIGHAKLGAFGEGVGTPRQQVHDGDTITAQAIGGGRPGGQLPDPGPGGVHARPIRRGN
jgi:hypothetical protein